MENRRNFYRILQVQPDAPVEVIKASYRTLMQRLRMHPDLGGDHWNAALINEAYAVLTDPAKRAAYDDELGERRKSAGTGPARGASPDDAQETAGDGLVVDCLFCRTPNRTHANRIGSARCTTCRSPLERARAVLLNPQGQRAVDRMPRNHPIALYTAWPQSRPLRGETRDVSLNGMSFVTPDVIRPQSVVKVDSSLCQAVVRVLNVRVEDDGRDGRWLVGGEFLSVIFTAARGGFLSTEA